MSSEGKSQNKTAVLHDARAKLTHGVAGELGPELSVGLLWRRQRHGVDLHKLVQEKRKDTG